MERCCVRLSVVVTYVLWLKNTENKLCEEANRVSRLLFCGINSDPLRSPLPQTGALTAPTNTCIANRTATKPLQLAAWLLLTAYMGTYKRLIQRCLRRPRTDTSSFKIGVPAL